MMHLLQTIAVTLVCMFLPLAMNADDSIPPKKGLVRVLYEFVKEFSRVDTNYVEPQHYNFTAMLQSTNTYEVYKLSNHQDNREVVFSPKPSIKVGPYFGWRWIFLGYTLDFSHLGGDDKEDYNLSLYSNQIGVDLFYRKMGGDYKIRSIHVGDNVDVSPLKDMPFDGIDASVKGFNLYYIFNHRKFSYPAAYAQSTVQRRSAGSPMAGIGFTKHSLRMDWARLYRLASERLGYGVQPGTNDGLYGNVRYTDVSLSGGYGYNWVFAHNWLFNASLSLALSYKHTAGDSDNDDFLFIRNFSLSNVNLDGVGRFGLVWNNTKWYFGANTVFHSYNYHKSQFSTNNFFGSVNIYIGFNFDRR